MKVASLITQTVDGNIMMDLDAHIRDPRAIRGQLALDYDTMTSTQHVAARKAFADVNSGLIDAIGMEENFNELLRKVTMEGGAILVDEQLRTLLGALIAEYDILCETFFSRDSQPDIHYVWDKMFNIEITGK